MPFITSVTTSESSNYPVSIDTSVAPISSPYTFPANIGADGEVLLVDGGNTELIWGEGGGGGDIANGFQTGLIEIGSTDNKLILQGATGIQLIGGLDLQYDDLNSGAASITLEDRHEFVEISNALTTNIILPAANARPGKKYIISKGYDGGTLTVSAQVPDTIDGDLTFDIIGINNRLSLISAGDRWLIV